ncbi:MAG: FAD:protein FMN transferase [Kiritimatiellae bacterium]|nr:FAD:protein FMN transferase [Kiritimatiellia bacterium]
MAGIQPRAFSASKTLLVAITILVLFFWSAHRARHAPRAFELSGPTMGTTYHIRVVAPGLTEARAGDLKSQIDAYLTEFNDEFSPYNPSSVLSRVNAAPAHQPIEVPQRFARALSLALDLARRSGGALDPTVGPLIRLWGFHDAAGPRTPPEAEVEAARERCGWTKVGFDDAGRVVKTAEGVELDFNSFVPGLACDEVQALLQQGGISNCFVEIGGEIRVSGQSPSSRPWRIGLDAPIPGTDAGKRMTGVVQSSDGGVATSGGYRNFISDARGARSTHVFDPRTLRPVDRVRQSVTVVAPDAMTADALATTLYVMGEDEGLKWLAREYPGVHALFVQADESGVLTEAASPDFMTATAFLRPPDKAP